MQSANKKSIGNWRKICNSGGNEKEHDKKTAAQAPVKSKANGKWSSSVFQQSQILLNASIVDAQELVGAGCHVNRVGLALGSFLVHETVYRVIFRLCF